MKVKVKPHYNQATSCCKSESRGVVSPSAANRNKNFINALYI